MVTGSIYCGIYFNGFYYVYKSDRLHTPLMIKHGMLHVLYNPVDKMIKHGMLHVLYNPVDKI